MSVTATKPWAVDNEPATKCKGKGKRTVAAAFRQWTLLPVPVMQIRRYHIGRPIPELNSYGMSAPRCTEITMGPAKNDPSQIASIPRTVEQIVLDQLQMRNDQYFKDIFYGGLSHTLRSLSICESGGRHGNQLLDDLFAHHFPSSLVELKISAPDNKDFISRATSCRASTSSTCSTATRLKLDVPFYNDQVMNGLKLDRRLRHLAVRQNDGCVPFLPALGRLIPASLVSLDLAGALFLAKADLAHLSLRLPPTLEWLSLRACGVSAVSIKALTKMWPPALAYLDLGQNDITEVVAPLPRKIRFLGLSGKATYKGVPVDDLVRWVRAIPRSLRTLAVPEDTVTMIALATALLAHYPTQLRYWRLRLQTPKGAESWPVDWCARLQERFDLIEDMDKSARVAAPPVSLGDLANIRLVPFAIGGSH
ncbi:hypothetical protein GGF32_006122 [Allomyces javanicus]|nr:hypothetical protein GGF32_006122 [Allomyces javanicus]